MTTLTVDEYRAELARRMPERELQVRMDDYARSLGYLVHHQPRSHGSEPGPPDSRFVGYGRLIHVEFKTERGQISRVHRVTKRGRILPCQLCWLKALFAAPGELYVVRPHSEELFTRALEPLPSPERQAAISDLLVSTRGELALAEQRGGCTGPGRATGSMSRRC